MEPNRLFPAEVDQQIEAVKHAELVVGVLTYNHGETLKRVVDAVGLGLEKYAARVPVALVDSDAGSADDPTRIFAQTGLPLVLARHEAPARERLTVPYHGVPGRTAGIRVLLDVARRLGARAVLLVEGDVVSIEPEWIERLARPVMEDGADLVLPIYARHRYDGTITNLLVAPLVRALFGRRIRQPIGGQYAISGRLAQHFLGHAGWDHAVGRDVFDLWMSGVALSEGFSVWETWLGPHVIESRTRTADLPTMLAETLGGVFGLMHRHPELWMHASPAGGLPVTGPPVLPSTERRDIGLARMISAFRLGVKDLLPIWQHILARDTLEDVLSLDASEDDRFRFPDSLWVRVVYDFAVGHHLGVLHRDHLLRSIVPLYLGRVASFLLETLDLGATATEARLDALGAAFEREKPYLVSHWTE